jgi:hypothetical protein
VVLLMGSTFIAIRHTDTSPPSVQAPGIMLK